MSDELIKNMRLFKGGDEAAFEAVYEETKKRVFYVILAILKDYHAAEDILQETYIKVRQNISKYREGGNPSGWIASIARNTALNEYERRKHEMPVDPEENEPLFKTYTMDQSMAAAESMMKCLDVSEREIVALHAILNFKHSEIAEITSKPLGTVLWIYNRAIKKLKKELREEES